MFILAATFHLCKSRILYFLPNKSNGVIRQISEQKNKKFLQFSGSGFAGKNDNLLDIATGSELFLFNVPPVVYGAG